VSEVVIRPLGRPGDLGWVVMAHGELYTGEFGWDASFETLVARIVADHAGRDDDGRAGAWIAELDGRRVGCVFCTPADHQTAQLRILLVHPDARGHGLGRRLVDTCVDFARDAGYSGVRLWTNDVLAAARCIYLNAGFRLVGEERHHSFGVDLVGQDYVLDLRTRAAQRTVQTDSPTSTATSIAVDSPTIPSIGSR
jgi:GNAT superfamily N-acetyltransferase